MGWKFQLMKKLLAILSISALSIASFAATKNVSGTWMVMSNGKLNSAMKLVFTPQGSFRFVGSNYSSSGTYKVQGNAIVLNWTKVDGEAVKPGVMHRTLNLSPDNTFTIDQYTYSRHS